MLSLSLADYKSLTLNVMVQGSQFVDVCNSQLCNQVTKPLNLSPSKSLSM